MQHINQKEIFYLNSTAKYTAKLRRALFSVTLCSVIAIIFAVLLYLCKNIFSSKVISAVYTDKLFYYINMPLKLFSRLFPFSIGELLFYIAITLFFVSLFKAIFITTKMFRVYFTLKSSKKKSKIRHAFKPLAVFGLHLVSIVCILISIFILFGGINYTGVTYAERAGYVLEKTSTNDLKNLCIYLGSQASLSRSQIQSNFDSTINENYPGYNPYTLADEAQIAYKNIPDYYCVPKEDYPNAKFALGSYFMSNIHITGIYPYIFPEAIVNIDTPIMTLPHTICHEMAHQRGFAREDEANFVAFLACIHSENPLMRYSGYYVAFSYAMDQLYIYDNEAWKNILNSLNSDVILDIKKEAAYWENFHTISSEITTNVNNTYLSTMDIEDGVESYGRMVDLLIAEAKIAGII